MDGGRMKKTLRTSDQPFFVNDLVQIYNQDTIAAMRSIGPDLADAVVTSPPYFCACDYEDAGQYGLETSLEEYLAQQVAVFQEVRRLLKHGGTCWIVIGDVSNNESSIRAKADRRSATSPRRRKIQPGILEKSILGVPFLLAQALQADGWLWRNTLIWDKGSCGAMAKSDTSPQTHEFILQMARWDKGGRPKLKCRPFTESVIRAAPVSDAQHPCPFPPALIKPLILAASEPGDIILDPYCGSGTTLAEAQRWGRRAIGIELNPKFAEIAADSCRQLSLAFAALNTA
jgi:site-specific DNA-methyltransferase (cytosine-N4-specific)